MERFKPNPSGRRRTKAAPWHRHLSRSNMLVMDIFVPVRSGQQTQLVEKLRVIQQADLYTLTGTVARYVIKGDEALTTIHIILIWKGFKAPNEVVHQEDFHAFREALNDVLDWERAEYSVNEMIIHT